MDVVQLLQFLASILTPVTLWLVNSAYQRGIRERAEIMDMLKEYRERQQKIEERVYKVELQLEIRAEPPTHMKRPEQF